MDAAVVAVHSLLESSLPVPTVIHLLHTDGLSAEHLASLSSVVARHAFAELQLHDLAPMLALHAEELRRVSGTWSLAIWGRWFIPDLLDGVRGRVLYLDTDVLVVKDLGELFATDLGAAVIGAVGEDNGKTGNFPAGERFYFNSGVLLMDLDGLRASDCYRRLVAFLAESGELSCPDQDALNALFGDRAVYLHARWNFNDAWVSRQLHFRLSDGYWRGRPAREVLESVADPGIIHYIGVHKPWRDGASRPEGARYLRAMRQLAQPVPRRGRTAWLRDVFHFICRRIAVRRLRKLMTKVKQ